MECFDKWQYCWNNTTNANTTGLEYFIHLNRSFYLHSYLIGCKLFFPYKNFFISKQFQVPHFFFSENNTNFFSYSNNVCGMNCRMIHGKSFSSQSLSVHQYLRIELLYGNVTIFDILFLERKKPTRRWRDESYLLLEVVFYSIVKFEVIELVDSSFFWREDGGISPFWLGWVRRYFWIMNQNMNHWQWLARSCSHSPNKMQSSDHEISVLHLNWRCLSPFPSISLNFFSSCFEIKKRSMQF